MFSVLIVEDNRSLSLLMCRALKGAGYAVKIAAGIREGLLKAKGCGLVLLDILLPDGNGLQYLSEFRRITSGEVLLISSLTREDEVAAGLTRGGDDYIRKPFSMQELIARVGASFRRCGGFASASFSGELTRLERRLLETLVRADGRPVSRKALYREVWDWQGEGNASRSVDAAVVRLRKKLALLGDGGGYIETVRGKGYRFVGEGNGCIKS